MYLPSLKKKKMFVSHHKKRIQLPVDVYVNETYCGDHSGIYTTIGSLCCIQENDIMCMKLATSGNLPFIELCTFGSTE